DQPADWIEQGIAEPYPRQRDRHGARCQNVRARVHGISKQQFALERAPAARLVADDEEIHGQRDAHHHEAAEADLRRRRVAIQPPEYTPQPLDDDEHQEYEDAASGERLVLAMAVRVIFVGRLARGTRTNEADDGRRA